MLKKISDDLKRDELWNSGSINIYELKVIKKDLDLLLTCGQILQRKAHNGGPKKRKRETKNIQTKSCRGYSG